MQRIDKSTYRRRIGLNCRLSCLRNTVPPVFQHWLFPSRGKHYFQADIDFVLHLLVCFKNKEIHFILYCKKKGKKYPYFAPLDKQAQQKFCTQRKQLKKKKLFESEALSRTTTRFFGWLFSRRTMIFKINRKGRIFNRLHYSLHQSTEFLRPKTPIPYCFPRV